MNAAQAFIAFLLTEAKQAEERAKSLRATANSIEANERTNGSSSALQNGNKISTTTITQTTRTGGGSTRK